MTPHSQLSGHTHIYIYVILAKRVTYSGEFTWMVLRYDTIGKIELNPSFVLSSDNTNYKNDIQLFHQLFDELSVYRDYH